MKSGNSDLVKLLVDSGARISAEDGGSLREAVKSGNEKMVDVLLGAGGNPCAKELNNQSAIQAAASTGGFGE